MGHLISFEYNLTASAMGCKSPRIPTLFGPIRICMYPKIFRSKSVINATLTKEKIKIVSRDIICKVFIEI